ncbi:hypothetical protein J2X57_002783 [Luteibacter sp. 1214]|uniref:MobA/MobL family protein n=1 Tax=Luteibacter sp. 1214 TaxID=2817735 RepID=UPI002856FA44|nr:MobA/MobL family protein [Luteibacter sp. 1214]MDR6643562.1 hypothetical protein [Luteibacter sp. 1214]
MTSTPTPVTPAKHARPHLTTHNRAQGHSSVAGAAYRLGLKLTDERTGETHDFKKRKAGEEIVRAVTVAPSGAPGWASDPQALWNRVEASENRKDAQVARDYRVPIPLGLTDEQAGDLAVDLAEFIRDALGVPVSVGLHRDADRDALGNVKPDHQQGFHAHLYFPTRPLVLAAGTGAGEGGGDTGHGFGPKLAMLSNKRQSAEWVEAFNEKWAELSNEYLAAADLPPVFDHRSYVRQGVDAVPQPKMGTAATAMERKGMATARGDVLREALVMAEVQKKVRVATTLAVQMKRPHTAAEPVPSMAHSSNDVLGAAATLQPSRSTATAAPIVITPRTVLPRAQRMVRTGAPGIKVTLAQQVAAAGPKPTNDAEQMALERSVELVGILEGFLQTASAQMKEHANLVEQARRAQQHALDLSNRIEDSRRRRERARRDVRDLTALHPVCIRLSKAGLRLKDPRQGKMAPVALHDRHVQEDKRAHRSLKAAEGVAWEAVKLARAELDLRKTALQQAVAGLAVENLPALHQVLGFLPDEAADLVREAMRAALVAAEGEGEPMVQGGLGVVPGPGLKPRVAAP